MAIDQWSVVQSVFDAVIDLPGDEQLAALERLCAGDAALQASVIRLVQEDARPQPLLDQNLSALASHALGQGAMTGLSARLVGPYRLLRLLGEGGMGVVYLAERTDIGGHVALKLLRDAWMSPARQQRFRREQMMLARLHHPHIARIYDAGVWEAGLWQGTAADSGTPWFAMEYAEGAPLTEGIVRRAGSLRQDLLTFREVCEAVQYAHSLAIVHRDLKPSNILMAENGDIKLLDFGIARHLEPDTGDRRTIEGLRMMTPLYAAPEQRNGGEIGVFTDIYTLGVLLYEILTRQLPPGPLNGLDRLPPRPSAARPAHADVRPYATSAEWSDLDALCLAALHPEPERRYRSVDGMIRDIDAFLDHRVLSVRAPRFPYYARKFALRHKSGLLSAAVILIVLVLGWALFTLRLSQARNAALAELARTNRIQNFTEGLFDAGDPEEGRALDISNLEMLRRGEAEAESLRDDPVMQADLLSTIGVAYQRLGQLARADVLLQQAYQQRRARLTPQDVRNVESLVALGLLRKDQGRMPEAETLLRNAVALRADHVPPAPVDSGRPLWALGLVLGLAGKYRESQTVLQQAVTLDSRSRTPTLQLGEDLAQLADAHFYLGDYDSAIALNKRAVEIERGVLGESHPVVGQGLNSLGQIEENRGHLPQAESYFLQGLDIDQRWYGPDHPAVAADLASLAKVHISLNELDQAHALLLRALAILERTFGPQHPRVALVYNDLGQLAFIRDRYDEAERDFGEALTIWQRTYGERHTFVGLAYANLSGVSMHRKNYVLAEEMARKALAIYQATLPPDHVNLGAIHVRLGRILLRQGRYAEAEPETLAGLRYFQSHESGDKSYLNGASSDLAQIQAHLQNGR